VVWADPNPKGFQWSWYSGQVTDTTHLDGELKEEEEASLVNYMVNI